MRNKFVAVFLMTTLFVLGLAGAAFAVPPTIPADPTAGGMEEVQTGVQNWVITYGIPTVFALVILGILIRLGLKWAKRAGRAV